MRHTESVTVTLNGLGKQPLCYEVSPAIAKQVEQMLKQSHKKKGDSIPVEEAFPVLNDPVMRPATVLRGMRYRENLTQAKLAEKLGIRQHHLSEIENGKRPIGKEMAKKLARALRADYRVFL